MQKALLSLALVTLSAPTQDPIWSGPQPGERLPGFTVLGMTGEVREKEHDFVAEYAGAPTVIVFIKEITRASGHCFRGIDDAVWERRDEGLRALFVLLPKDQAEAERYGLGMAKLVDIQSDLGVSVDGGEGPGSYGLNKDVAMTVLVAKDDVVTANFALISPNDTDVPKVMAAVEEILLPDLESPEGVKAELLRLRQEVRELRDEVAALSDGGAARGNGGRGGARRSRGQDSMGAMDTMDPMDEMGGGADRAGGRASKAAGAPPSDPTIDWMIRAMIHTKSAEEIADLAVYLDSYVGTDAELRAELTQVRRWVVSLGMGTDDVRRSLGVLVAKYEQGGGAGRAGRGRGTRVGRSDPEP